MGKFLKYAASDVTFSEYPNEVALYIEISGCPIHCKGCHSKFLWEDTGIELSDDVIENLISKNEGISAVVIGGGDQDEKDVIRIIRFIKTNFPWLKVCWYSGKSNISSLIINFIKSDKMLDAIKIGPYIESAGPLNKETTNQQFLTVDYHEESRDTLVDIELVDNTELFWKKQM